MNETFYVTCKSTLAKVYDFLCKLNNQQDILLMKIRTKHDNELSILTMKESFQDQTKHLDITPDKTTEFYFSISSTYPFSDEELQPLM